MPRRKSRSRSPNSRKLKSRNWSKTDSSECFEVEHGEQPSDLGMDGSDFAELALNIVLTWFPRLQVIKANRWLHNEIQKWTIMLLSLSILFLAILQVFRVEASIATAVLSGLLAVSALTLIVKMCFQPGIICVVPAGYTDFHPGKRHMLPALYIADMYHQGSNEEYSGLRTLRWS